MNATQTRSTSRQRWVLALSAISSLMVILDVMVVTTALNTIRLKLHASLDQLEWTLNAFTLTFAVLLMTAAALGDHFGRRRMLTGGVGWRCSPWDRLGVRWHPASAGSSALEPCRARPRR